jgi:hypothetical protein
MVGIGALMILTGLTGVWLWWRGRLFNTRWYLWPAQHAWWLGFVAVICGWIVTETGRQPWVGYGVLRTADAVASFEYIIDDGKRAGAIIDGVRAIFKKDGRDRTSLDINELIAEALAFERDELQKHRVSVQAELNEQLPRVRVDRVQMQQVLVNLITNAIDSMAAMDEPRVLCIKSEVHDAISVMVSFADTGKGIGLRDFERIFDPRFTTKSGGMGLGLSICRSIIEAHDGRLWAAPNAPRGAAFQFVLHADTAARSGVSTESVTARRPSEDGSVSRTEAVFDSGRSVVSHGRAL